MMVISEIEMIREKLDFFLDNNIKIHVDLNDGTFLNGTIIKKSREGIYWIDERKLGGVFLFLNDISKIREFVEVKK